VRTEATHKAKALGFPSKASSRTRTPIVDGDYSNTNADRSNDQDTNDGNSQIGKNAKSKIENFSIPLPYASIKEQKRYEQIANRTSSHLGNSGRRTTQRANNDGEVRKCCCFPRKKDHPSTALRKAGGNSGDGVIATAAGKGRHEQNSDSAALL
jgi:hypothetical protein